jgi:hypothetical protein
MISDAGATLAPTLTPVFTSRASTPVVTAAPEGPAGDVETAEQEITRLTWSVLDGSAALADRQRLAELVNAPHAQRPRTDP